jgi:ATP-dependent Clp protease ATP-binding subunit ClpA
MDQIEVDVLNGMPASLLKPQMEIDDFAESVERETGIDVPFTAAAQRVLESAEEFAHLIGGQAILTEHLLLAISSTPECAAAKLIQEHRGSTQSLLSALEFVIGSAGPPPPDFVPSPRLGRVITRAKREAFRHNHTEVTTLHLLMALIKERQGAACYVLDTPSRGLTKLVTANTDGLSDDESD